MGRRSRPSGQRRWASQLANDNSSVGLAKKYAMVVMPFASAGLLYANRDAVRSKLAQLSPGQIYGLLASDFVIGVPLLAFAFSKRGQKVIGRLQKRFFESKK